MSEITTDEERTIHPEDDRDQLEALALERDAAIAELRSFADDTAHELRTSLTAILGHVDLYDAGALNDDADITRAMARIRAEGDRLSTLLDGLLVRARSRIRTPDPGGPRSGSRRRGPTRP